jgi:uncharacterized protein
VLADNPPDATGAASSELRKDELTELLRPRVEVEDYFVRSGRTLRKSRLQLWYSRKVKPFLLRSFLRLTGLYRRGQVNALKPKVREIDIPVEGLPPSLAGLTILHISDLHIDQMPALVDATLPLLRSVRPDICVLTGDFRFEIDGPCDPVYPLMRRLLGAISARLGTFGILGNHDAAEIAFHLENMNVRMLVNEAVELTFEKGSLWLIGLDDPFDYRRADLDRAMAGVPQGAFKVLLCHTPELFKEAAEKGISLYLCGHTHAGQIRLPYLGAIKKNADCPREFVQDFWKYERVSGYTSWGLGCSTVKVRYSCPPEVALLRLQRM